MKSLTKPERLLRKRSAALSALQCSCLPLCYENISQIVCSCQKWRLPKYRFCYLVVILLMFTLFLRMVSLRSRDSRFERASNAIYDYDYENDDDQYRTDIIYQRRKLVRWNGRLYLYNNTYLMEAGLQNNSSPSGQKNHSRLAFVMEDTKGRYLMDTLLIDFSEFLKNMLQDSPSLANYTQLQIELPSFLKVDGKILQLITLFHHNHNYQKEHIRVHKIKTSGWQNALDQTSRQFALTQLEPLPEETVRLLLSVCEYLKLNLLKDVVCVFIASRHFHCYNDIKMQKDLQELKVFYSRQMDINIKRSMLGYARQLGLDMLEKVEAKHERRRINLRR